MGRTGRKRAGKICLLLAEGQEEAKYRKSQSTYKSVQKAITQGTQLVYFPENPKIIPAGPLPACDLVHINVPTYINPALGKKRKRPDNESTVQTNRLRGAYLDPEELAQFQQRYRLPKKQIRRITFNSACTTMLKSKTSTMVPDKTFVVGHSTRTQEYIKNVNLMAKARVEQSLNSTTRTLAPDEPDPYTKRMLALLEKSKNLDHDWYHDQDDDSTGRSRLVTNSLLKRNKKSDVYSHDSLDDDEMEDLGRRMGGAKGSSGSDRRRKIILSDSEQEDRTTDDDLGRGKAVGGHQGRPKVMPKPRRKQTAGLQKMGAKGSSGSHRLRKVILSDSELEDRATTTGDDLGRGKAAREGDQGRPEVMPKPRRNQIAGPQRKDSRNEAGDVLHKSGGKDKSAAAPVHGSIKSYFHTVSDDEVDREIMGGLDNMFGLPEDHQYSRGPTMSPIPYNDGDDQPLPMCELGAKMQRGFDFHEPTTLPTLWYRTSASKNDGHDDFPEEEEEEVSLVAEPVMAFVVFDIPPVPLPGQWYRSDQEAPNFANDHRDYLSRRTLPTAKPVGNSDLGTTRAPLSPREVMLIESSDDDARGRLDADRNGEERYEVPGGSRSHDQDSRRMSNNGQQGFVSARILNGSRLEENGNGSPSSSQGRRSQRNSFGQGLRQGQRHSQGRSHDQGLVQSQKKQVDVGQQRRAVKTAQLWGDPNSSSNNEFEFEDDILPDLDDYDLWD